MNEQVETDVDEKMDEDDTENGEASKNNEGDSPTSENDDPTEEERIEQLKEERDEFKEKYLRKSADLKNLRERKKQERKEYMKYANKSLLKDLLEIIDNFERAMEFESGDPTKGDDPDGVKMIHDQLVDLLTDYDVEKIDADGEPFDPHRHEGMMREEREDLDQQTVLEVFNEGYMLHDRVLRPAQVKVGVPASTVNEEEQSNGNPGKS